MRKISPEIASGIALFLAFIIFVAGFLFLKNVTLKRGHYKLYIHFNDVTGLEPSDFVSVSGLRIGKVTKLRLNDLKVVVEIEVLPDIHLPKDSRAQIKNLGMVGEKFIDIIPGTSTEMLQDGDTIEGSAAGDFTDLTGSMEGLMAQAEEFLIQLRATFENVFDHATQRDMKQSISSVNRLTSVFGDNAAHLEKTLRNLDELTTNMNEILAARREQMETSIDNLYQASNRLEGLTDKVENSLESMQTLLASIENQEGALGKVILNDDLYNDLRHLTTELDGLVQDLKKRPQKYLNLGFIKVF
ncbi:MAG: MCE family protein [Calditrichaeota bacterium]|nr:MAG: MCE family protein [Calditrichota bacterium]